MDGIAEQLARRDRLRRHLRSRESYEQRWRACLELQERTWRYLRPSPEGWAHFIRRNYRARAVRPDGSGRPAPAIPMD
jgi:hypothetical protein